MKSTNTSSIMRIYLTLGVLGIGGVVMFVTGGRGEEVEAPDGKGLSAESRARTHHLRLTPEEAAQLLGESRTLHKDAHQRAKYCAVIIENLCRSGYTDEAWELIEDSKGVARTAQLARFFKEAKWSDEKMLNIILGNTREMDHFLPNFFSRFTPEQLAEMKTSGVIEQLRSAGVGHQQVADAITSALSEPLAKGGDPEWMAALRAGRKLSSTGVVMSDDFNHIVLQVSKGDPFGRWAAAQEVMSGTRLGEADRELQDGLLRNMVQHHATRTLELLTKAGDSEESLGWLCIAVKHWLIMEPNAATEWYEDHRSWLSIPQRDAVCGEHFTRAVESRDRVTAEKWLNQISNDDIREFARENILE